MHWHGVRLANAMDGAPPLTQTPIAPGASFDYRFVAPDAGTFWYHPARRTNGQLCGALIVTEPGAVDVDHEVTLIFTAPGTDGETKLLANGADFATLVAAANQRVRLRLVNASMSQIFKLRIADLPAFVMAIDGQPAQPFVARAGELTLGPGNRIDVFVDWPPRPQNSARVSIEGTNGDLLPIAKLITEAGDSARRSPRDAPKPLPPNPLPERMDFRGGFKVEAVAGKTGKRDAPLFEVRRGRTVMLAISNPRSASACMHLHGHSFRLLDVLDDGWKPFWLDTMPLVPGGKARIAFVADNPGKWLIEGLAAGNGDDPWFEVS